MQLAASHEKERGLAAVAGSVTSGSSGSFTQLRMDDEERAQGHRALMNANKKACGAETIAVADLRRRYIGPNHATMYDQPLHVVRGSGTTLYTADGNEYLDCVNNVAHVGHCHPKVANAVAAQLGVLNTNSRYLHENFSGHAAALAATMPEQLGLMYATCSGSESNDLALRVAKKASMQGATHVIVMDGAYHGHTSATMDLSPYKFNGPGGNGQPAHVQVMPCPDLLRKLNLDGGAAARAAIMRVREAGGRVCAFFSESILSCGGQVVLPPGYLQAVYAEMRTEGAVCVADEVQCGFGRVGTHFWGFETQDIIPDMVTLGKPIGNGFPMGAVIMTPTLANAFNNGEQYFATCGGCTAAGAAGLAVLQVIEEEGLQQAAQEVGAHLLARLEVLQQGRPYLGDVRGLGLMVGVEVVTDGHSLARAPKLAHWIKEEMKLRRVLLTTDGAHCDNILKIKPPLVFSRGDAVRLVEELQAVLNCFDALPGRERNALLEPWVVPAGARRECTLAAPAAAALHPGAAQKKQRI